MDSFTLSPSLALDPAHSQLSPSMSMPLCNHLDRKRLPGGAVGTRCVMVWVWEVLSNIHLGFCP